MNIRDRIIYGFYVALALLLPIMAVYVAYDQLSIPIFDASIDRMSGEILLVEPESYANVAGFQTGDVILSINNLPYPQMPLKAGNYQARIQRGTQVLTMEMPLVSMAVINPFVLINGLLVALSFWGVSTFLLWRRYRQFSVRLFFLIAQSIGIGLLFLLSYPDPTNRPVWMAVIISIGFHTSASFLVHYYLTFPVTLGTRRQRRWILSMVYGLMVVALACRLSNTSIGLRITYFYNTMELITAFCLQIYVYFRRADSDDRRKLRIIIFGSFVSLISTFIFYLLPTILGTVRVSDSMVGPFIIIIPVSYLVAIAHYNLFGIDRFLNRTLVYFVLWLGILVLYLGPFLLITRFVQGDWLAQMLVYAVLTLLVGISFENTKKSLQRNIDRIFYGGWYDYPGVVEKVTGSLVGCTTREELSDVLTRQVPILMQLQNSDLLFDIDSQPSSEGSSASFCLTFQENTSAIWTLAAHRDKDDLSDFDRRILGTLAKQAEIALGNVLLIETLRTQLDEIRASREALSQAQHRLMRSREDERARLARDLHDGPLQTLIGLNLQLGLLAPQMVEPAQVNEMRSEVLHLLDDLRGVCSELRPPMLDTLGLSAALRSLAEDWSEQTGVPVQLNLPPYRVELFPLPDDVAVNLYRVAQEALSNIAKHANANKVEICLLEMDGGLTLSIDDDGCGFNMPVDIGVLTTQEHFGLVGLRERVNLIGGTLYMESTPGKGTHIHIEWKQQP
jgi:signal transduction histidine kinase